MNSQRFALIKSCYRSKQKQFGSLVPLLTQINLCSVSVGTSPDSNLVPSVLSSNVGRAGSEEESALVRGTLNPGEEQQSLSSGKAIV